MLDTGTWSLGIAADVLFRNDIIWDEYHYHMDLLRYKNDDSN